MSRQKARTGMWPDRDWADEEMAYKDYELRLPAGEWVLRGSVRVYVEAPAYTPPFMPAPTLGHTCHCGCLLINEGEVCPQCFVWAVKNAEKWARNEKQTRIPTPGLSLSSAIIGTSPDSAPTPIRGLTHPSRINQSEGSVKSTYPHPSVAISSEVA